MRELSANNGYGGPPPGCLEVEVVSHGDRCTVAAHGELDLATVDQLRARLDGARDGRIVLDLRGLTFIDSSGLRLLVEMAREGNGRFSVVPGPPQVQREIELTGLSGAISFVDAPAEG